MYGVYTAGMDTSLTLLGLLDSGCEYGYELKHDYDRWFSPSRPLAFGQVYATLARLIKNGFIETLGTEAGSGPDRKRYAVTPAGHERLAEWMDTPDVPGYALQSNLFAKTVIALLVGDEPQVLLDRQRAEHLARMRELTARKRDADLRTVLLADHALFHIEADLRWIELTSARIDELRAEVRR